MSFLSKLMDTMRLNDGDEDDDYFLDSDYEDEDKPARKSLLNGRRRTTWAMIMRRSRQSRGSFPVP